MWKNAGVPISTIKSSQHLPTIICDDAADAYVVWQDYRNGYSAPDYYGADLYGQLLNGADGSPAWDSAGIAIVSAPQDQFQQQISLNGSNQVSVLWSDNRAYNGNSETSYVASHIYAKCINGDGTTAWGDTTGVPVCTAANYQNQPVMVNANNSILAAWHDARNGAATQGDLYAQWVLPPGERVWTSASDTINFGSILPGFKGGASFTMQNLAIPSGIAIDSIAFSSPVFGVGTPVSGVRAVALAYAKSASIGFTFTPQKDSAYAGYALLFNNFIATPDTVYCIGSGAGGRTCKPIATRSILAVW